MKKLMLLFIFFNAFSYGQQFVEMSPFELICAERFDVMAKYIYARHRQIGVVSGWPLEIYREHLRVWGNFHEARPSSKFIHFNCAQEYPVKNSFQDYLTAFNTYLDSMAREGFDTKKSVLPIDKNGVIMDGSHRLTAALISGEMVTATIFNTVAARYDSDYFKKFTYYIPNGLDESYLDAMALEYIGLKTNTYIAIVFPCVNEKLEEIKNILNSYGKIVYEKEVLLTNKGSLNLLSKAYEGETWIGSHLDNFSGIQCVLKRYFPGNNGIIRVFLFECKNLSLVKKAKKDVRALFNFGNCAMHINDTYQETLKMGEMLFLKNSVHWLNNFQFKCFSKFESYLKKYKKWIEENNINSELLCVDTSAVLSAYGLRDCNDLDFLSYDSFLDSIDRSVSNHESEMKYHIYSKEDIIFDPRNHFYYDGLKFAALHVVKAMKSKRNEVKDRNDIALINKILN